MFQSRNRDTFRFKDAKANLIEYLENVLFQSRNRDTFRFKGTVRAGIATPSTSFQSRNRDTFRFKRIADNSEAAIILVSIS